MKTGLLHYYSGRGKGKTTAALGLALRAAGHGSRAIVIQFLKTSNRYGELAGIKPLDGLITIIQKGRPCRNPGRAEPGFICTGCMACHVDPSNPDAEDIRAAREALALASEHLRLPRYEIIILDEIGYAVEMGLISADDVISVLASRSPNVEVVITGGGLNRALEAVSDYVTDFAEIRHHLERGVSEVKGIDY